MRILEFKFKMLNLKTLSAGLFTNRVHGRETLAVSSLVTITNYCNCRTSIHVGNNTFSDGLGIYMVD